MQGKQVDVVEVYLRACVQCRTLDDRQKDDNHEEKEGDVEDDAIDLVLVASRVLNLVPDSSTCPDANVHVEHVALGHRRGRREKQTSSHLLVGLVIFGTLHEKTGMTFKTKILHLAVVKENMSTRVQR